MRVPQKAKKHGELSIFSGIILLPLKDIVSRWMREIVVKKKFLIKFLARFPHINSNFPGNSHRKQIMVFSRIFTLWKLKNLRS